MGRVDLLHIESTRNSQFLERNYKFILTEKELDLVFTILSQNLNNSRITYANYIYGYGGQVKSIYEDLNQKKKDDFDVLWYGKRIPKFKSLKGLFVKFINLIFASNYGLIKIKNPAITIEVLTNLSNSSMAGFFSFSINNSVFFENTFFENLNNINYTPEEAIQIDSSFFYFIVDGGGLDDKGIGYLCQCGYGKDCAEEWLKILDFTSKRW